MVQADSQSEPLKRLLIDLVQHRHQSDGELHHGHHVVLLGALLILCDVEEGESGVRKRTK